MAVSDDDNDDDDSNDIDDARSAELVMPWSTPPGMRTFTWSVSGPLLMAPLVTCLCPWLLMTSSSVSSGETQPLTDLIS